MKWLSILKINFKATFRRSGFLKNKDDISLQKGKKLYGRKRFAEALIYLDQAANRSFDAAVYGLRAKCFQKLNFHAQAVDDFDKMIENNPLDFLNYYSRAVSKRALQDVEGQLEDLQNCIYYCKKNSIAERITLKKVEADLIETRSHLEGRRQARARGGNMPHLCAENIITECLSQVKKIRNALAQISHPTHTLKQIYSISLHIKNIIQDVFLGAILPTG